MLALRTGYYTMHRLDCQSCGQKVDVPEQHTRPRIRCGACGYYVDVPAAMRGRAEEPVAVATKPAKKKREVPNLISGTQHDDDNPYSVPGDPTKKCTGCFKEIDIDATFCVFCGVDFASGKKAKKKYEAIDRTWESRWPRELRLKVLFALMLINGVLATIAVVRGGSVVGGFVFILMQGGLQAFLIGTYETLRVQRTSKGSATITKLMRIAFVPTQPLKLDWKASQGVGIIAIHQPGIVEWITFIYLLFCGVLPGILFWYFVMRPDRFHISLCDVYGSTNHIAFRTTDRDQAEEICRTINDATGLWYKPVL